MRPTAKILITFLAGALAGSIALNVVQATRAAAPSPAFRMLPAGVLGELGLSDAQIERIEACCTDCCTDRDDLNAQLETAAADLEREIAREPLDRPRIRDLARRIGELRAERAAQCAESILAVREILTPAQLETLIRRCEATRRP
jgi:Spy/CpxP family protein refolding chaperone